MAIPALTGLAAAIVVYGFLVRTPWDDALRGVQFACVAAFALLQLSKLFFVASPAEYLRTHWIDFSMLVVFASQLFVHLGLRETPEAEYLASQDIPSPTWALLTLVVQIYFLAIVGARSPIANRILLRMRLEPAQMAVVSFLLFIAAGTAALLLPGCRRDAALPFVDALFTATSAVCVTGLVVRDTAAQFSTLGHAVLALLIQVGGLGVLTLTTAFAVFGGERLRRREERTLARAIDAGDERDMRALLGRVLTATFAIEAAGAIALFLAWRAMIPEPLPRAGWAAFHAVSAFCNAGFSLFRDNASLTGLVGDTPTILALATLIVLGGLGFSLLVWLGGIVARRERLPLTWGQRATLRATAVLLVSGALLFWLFEAHGVLAPLDGPTAALAAFFQSVTLRTAGFNSIDVAALGMPAIAMSILFMLIGGSPDSTAGGMKTRTVVALLPGPLRGAGATPSQRRLAARLALVYLASYAAIGVLLALAQGGFDRRIAFEAASALGTVGLSMNLTPELTTAGKLVVTVAMFSGRVGPLVLASALVWRDAQRA